MRKPNRNSKNTRVTAVRLANSQIEKLRKLPDGVSVSILMRALVDEYLKGNIPQIHAAVLQEAQRTASAMESTQFQRGE
jgi:hypothetical protein